MDQREQEIGGAAGSSRDAIEFVPPPRDRLRWVSLALFVTFFLLGLLAIAAVALGYRAAGDRSPAALDAAGRWARAGRALGVASWLSLAACVAAGVVSWARTNAAAWWTVVGGLMLIAFTALVIFAIAQ